MPLLYEVHASIHACKVYAVNHMMSLPWTSVSSLHLYSSWALLPIFEDCMIAEGQELSIRSTSTGALGVYGTPLPVGIVVAVDVGVEVRLEASLVLDVTVAVS